MGTLNVRLSPHDHRMLSADRDMAYCAHHLVARAVAGLDPDRLEPWVRKFLQDNNIQNSDLCEVATAIAEYMNMTLFNPLYTKPYDALERAGFFKLPEAVQIILLAKIGQVFLSTFFVAARDVTYDPDRPPVDKEVVSKAADELLDRIVRAKRG